MRPEKMTPAHETGLMGELVCSNSLGGEMPTTSAGILKAELKSMKSLIMECAEKSRVPAGNALAVDRNQFAGMISAAIEGEPLIETVRGEVTELPDEPLIIATGPLTSPALAEKLGPLVGDDFLYFYDAAAPIVTIESVDPEFSFRGSRYGSDSDYINCPMDEETYHAFWEALTTAETAKSRDFDEAARHFEGCLPVEVIAGRGEQTLLFGPMRPVGFSSSDGGNEYCAVVQLRQDNEEGTLFNMVGFQTNLKWGEQERVFRMIPALRNAEFVRKGVMHRNLFVCAPKVLDGFLRPNGRELTFLAGQITGVEGYMESTAMGLVSAIYAYCALNGRVLSVFPRETAVGSLLDYLRTAVADSFQPMNVNLGIFPKLDGKKIRRRTDKCLAYAARSEAALAEFLATTPEILY